MTASRTLENGYGFCVPKAVALAAACRAAGIPAALGFADVRNHLSTPRLTEIMNGDVFYHHGYTSIFLDGRWVKATPAFNKDLCDKAGLNPLEFDGKSDSIFHEFDRAGQRHMEYLAHHGEVADLPFDTFVNVMSSRYPGLMKLAEHDWYADIEDAMKTQQQG